MVRIQVGSKQERDDRVHDYEKHGYILAEEQRHFDGHFLVFEITPESVSRIVEEKIKAMVKAEALVAEKEEIKK